MIGLRMALELSINENLTLEKPLKTAVFYIGVVGEEKLRGIQ